MEEYLIKYLRDNAGDKLASKYIDFFKIELDWHIYNSANHIDKKYHRNRKLSWYEKCVKFYQYTYAISNPSIKSDKLNVLSTLKISDDCTIDNIGLKLFSPIWHPLGKNNIVGDLKSLIWHEKIQNLIREQDFNHFLDDNLHVELEQFQNHFIQKYKDLNFRALFLYSDQYFYSKYFIDVFNKLDKPTFVFTHGLPGIYSKDVDNRSDYIMVWGEKIKQNYIKVGFNPDKLKVIGNPKFKVLKKQLELKSDLSDILIIPVSFAPWHQHEYDVTVVSDSSKVVIYFYQLQSILKEFGVKKVRYRPHPSVNRAWLHAFLDQSFFHLDDQPLNDSIARSSLVIGGTSTVLLETLIKGVNYICYEPKSKNNLNIVGLKLVPPFDGSEPKLRIANDDDELRYLLKNNYRTDYSLVNEYIQDFDINILKDLIK